MISKAKIKFIKSLQIKKYRTQEQCFIVEGAKSISELVESDFRIREVFATREYLEKNHHSFDHRSIPIQEVSIRDLEAMGSFKTNDTALALADTKKNEPPVLSPAEFALVLDDIRDPGNLGTIVRTADWYGINQLIASSDSVDMYNPKVIAASMGSFTRINIFYTDLISYVSHYKGNVYGAFLDGQNIYSTPFDTGGLMVMGNESNGISKELEALITQRITIPRIGKAESLNVATATAIILDNVRRKGS